MNTVHAISVPAQAQTTTALPWWRSAASAVQRRLRTSVRPLSVRLVPATLAKESGALVPGHEAVLAAWRQWCEGHAGSHCHVALSAHWLLGFAAAPGQVASSWEHYFGLGDATLAEQWRVRHIVGHGEVSVVCAAPRALVQGLQAVAREHGVKILWMGPWWAPEVQGWLGQSEPGGDHWDAREAGLVTHLRRQVEDGTLCQLWTEVLDEPATTDPSVSAAPWPDTQAMPLVDTLDFVGPRVRTAPWSWALLVLGLVAALTMADRAQEVDTSLQAATQTMDRLTRARHQQQLARTAPRAAREASVAASSALTAPALRQAAGMVQLLAFPWTEVIEHVEQAASKEQAVLTSFNLDLGTLEGKAGAQPSARLSLAVRDDAAALRWLAAQGDDAQLLSRQLLSTPFDTLNGHYALRYEAAWKVDAASWRAQP